MTRIATSLAIALLAASSVPALAAPDISVNTLKSVTKMLSSDEFEGRAPTTPGEDKSIAYIAGRLEALGLQPGGDNGSWFQNVPMVEITSTPSPIHISGGKTPLDFAYRTDMVVGTYQVRPHVEVRDSEMVFVGYGVNAPERGWNDYAGLDVKGKTVVILINDPDWMQKKVGGKFDGRAMTYYGRWIYKFEEAARQGAAAAIIVHDTEPAAYPFGVVVSSWTGPQLGFDEPGDHMDQSKAIGWVTNDAARKLFAAAGKDYKALVAAAAKPGFKAVSLGLKASVSIDNSIRKQASKNVIGVLPGTAKPDEYVIYSAHWDHLGRCEPINGDDICNGALDNATGTAGLIALAEAHTKAGPARRSMLFVAVTGEESGLLGSNYFANHPTVPLASMVGGVNMDGLNILGKTRDIVLIGGGKSEIEDYVKRLAPLQGRVIKPEPTPEKGYYYRSDHFSLAKLGVPMLYSESGDDLVEGGVARGAALAADYTTNRYHKPQDEYDPKWDWSGALQDLELNYTIGRELAEGSAWPNWYPGSEFRAIRDTSRAGK